MIGQTASRSVLSGAVEFLERDGQSSRYALRLSIAFEPTAILDLEKEKNSIFLLHTCESRGSTAPVRTLKRKEMIGEIESNIFEICFGIR